MQTRLSPQTLMQIAEGSCRCEDEASFCAFIAREVEPCIPHRKLVAAVGLVEMEHIRIERLIGVGYAPEALQLFPLQLNLRERPVVKKWLLSREPCVIELPRDAGLTSLREWDEIEQLKLGRLAIHGMSALCGDTGSYFSFAQVDPLLPEAEVLRTLKLVAPYLHQALMQVHLNDQGLQQSRQNLTSVEMSVLRWVAAGRTNAQIAQLRRRSEATVRNQLHRIFAKLGVSSRAEATLAFQRLFRRMGMEQVDGD